MLVADPGLIPHGIDELAAGEDQRGSSREGLQDVKLGTCQRHLPTVKVDLASGQVDTQRAENSRRRFLRALPTGGGGSVAAHHRVDPGQQLAGAERLGNVVVRPHRQSDELVDLFVACGGHDDAAVGEPTHDSADLDTVQQRQAQIEDHDVGIDLPGQLDGLLPVVGQGDLKPSRFR